MLCFLLRLREWLRSIVMSMSVCVSVCPRGYLRNHTRDLYQIFVRVRGSVVFRHVYDRPPRLSPGFSAPLKRHSRPGKGDGSAQRGRSMLSTIALFEYKFFVFKIFSREGRQFRKNIF